MNSLTQQNPLQSWGQRVTQAYLGLDKAATDYTSFLNGVSAPQRVALQFMTDVSVLGLYCQSGKGVEKRTPSSQSTAEPQAAGSVRMSGHLGQILYGPYRDVLPQWCGLAIRNKTPIPSEMIPELLDIALSKKEYKALILSALGEKVFRLLERNPQWRPLLETVQSDASDWQTGMRQQRIEYLAAFRQKDPAGAREMLVSTWPQENGEDRVDFLKYLLYGLSINDEPFLEQALDDKRKGVREAAADLLSRIPGSGYGKRMAERAFSVISFTPASRFVIKIGKGKFEVSISDNPDKSWLRDIPENKASGGMGVKAVLLMQIIAGMQLSEWNRWQVTAADLIEAAMASDWAEAMLRGWFAAAYRQQNLEWIQLFLLRIDQIQKKYGGLNYALLIQSIDEKDRETILTEALNPQNGVKLFPILELLPYHTSLWSKSFSETVLKATKSCAPEVNEYQLRHLMDLAATHFALYMEPHMLPSLDSGWPEQSPTWTKSVIANLDQWKSVLQFRKEINEEFRS
jgi:hypothetical protein